MPLPPSIVRRGHPPLGVFPSAWLLKARDKWLRPTGCVSQGPGNGRFRPKCKCRPRWVRLRGSVSHGVVGHGIELSSKVFCSNDLSSTACLCGLVGHGPFWFFGQPTSAATSASSGYRPASYSHPAQPRVRSRSGPCSARSGGRCRGRIPPMACRSSGPRRCHGAGQ
jgi:hypothetical protein